jgi:DNA-binding winged helix-turn-helix (wHTH) protein
MRERTSETAVFGPFRFQPRNGLWHEAGSEVPLPPRALVVLETLVARSGEVVSKADLLDAGWPNAFVTEASLLEAVRVIRRALDDDRRNPSYVQTIHRRGYRFVAEVRWVADRPMPAHAPRAALAHSAAARADVPSADPSLPFFSGPEWRPIVTASALSATACIIVALAVALFGPPRPDGMARRFSIALPEAVRLNSLHGAIATSADGARLAFVALHEGRPHLFVRATTGHTSSLLPGTANASHPFFSPGGTALGFFADGRLKTIGVGDTQPVVLAAAVAGAGATWTNDDAIVFGGGSGGGLSRVSLGGGETAPVIAPRANTPDVRFGWPEVLPSGKGLIFTVITPAGSDVAILDPGASRSRILVPDAAFARYSPTGHLIAERDGQLVAVPFSIDRGAVTGPARPVVGDVASADVLDGPRFAFSQSGSLVYVPGPVSGPRSLRWVGTPRSEAINARALLVLDRDTAADRRLTLTRPAEDAVDAQAVSPTWRPDGLAVAFAQNKAGPFNLFVQPGTGGVPMRLDLSPWNQAPTSWSPDMRQLAFTEFHPATGADIWVLDVGSRTRRPIVRTRFDESGARYSPDGRWLAYLTNQSGPWEAVVQSALGGAVAARVPADRLVPESLAPESNGRELRVVLSWFSELAGRMRVPA